MVSQPSSAPEGEWPRHDLRYRRVVLAVVGTLVLAAAFSAYSVITKEIPVLYVTEPWKDDPYDALRSFGFIAIPVPMVLTGWRFLLSMAGPTVPVQRIIDLVRTCYLLAGLVLITIASEWLSVLLRTHVIDWTATTFTIIGMLGFVTLATLVVVVILAAARTGLAGLRTAGHPDWLDDGSYFLRLIARAAKPIQRPALVAADWIDRVVVEWIRRYPLTFVAIVAVVLALGGDARQIIGEGYDSDFAVYFLTVSATGYYAFFAIVCRYLNLIAMPPLARHPARLVGVAAAASVPLTEAFRQYLSWIIGLRGGISTPLQLYVLTVLIAAVTATVTLAIYLVVKTTAKGAAT